jgi:Mrp family chromosome partitioning ATPase/uncharacterized protein involved in exopolysaccharide biosynthesis
MNPEVQMVPVPQDTFVPENMDVSSGEGGGGNPLAKVHQYLRGRYLKAIVTGAILGAIGAAAGFTLVPVKYSSIGQIQVTSAILVPLRTAATDSNLISNYEGFVQTAVEQLSRHDVIRRAVNSPIWRAVTPQGGKSEAEEIADFADALEITHPRNTELIYVRFRDANPKRATAGVDALTNTFREMSETLTPDNYTERMEILNNQKRNLEGAIASLRKRIEDSAPDFHGSDLDQVHGQTLARLQELELLIGQVKVSMAGMPAMAPASQPANALPSAGGSESANPSQPASASQPGGIVATKPAAAELSMDLAGQYDPEIARLSAEIDRTVMEINRLLKRGVGRLNPAMVDLDDTMKSLQETRQRRFQGLKERLKNAPEAATLTDAGTAIPTRERMEARLAELQREFDRLTIESKKQTASLREIEGWRAEIAQSQKRLDECNAQIFSNEMNRPVNTIDRRIKPSPASEPLRPDKDRRIVAAAGGGFGGLALGFGIFALIGFFDRRLRSVADARDSLDRSNRILGILPFLPEDLSDPDQSSTAAFCVHHIRTLLQVGGSGNANSVMAITSASPGDGKTSLVISLGLSYAATGAKTLLIDSDLIGAGLTSRANAIARRKIGSILLREKRISQEQLDQALDQAHRTGKRLGEVLVDMGCLKQGELDQALSMQQESSLGLLDVLDGEPLSDCVFPGWANNLSILPVGNVGATHAGQLSLRAIRKILAEARTQYDVILIDTGPILGSLEACLIAAAVDEVIVAVARDQQRPLVEKTFSRLREVGARIAGIVFNRAPREDVETGGYMSSLASQRIQSPMIRDTAGDSKASRLQRLGPVVRAVAGGSSGNAGEGL